MNGINTVTDSVVTSPANESSDAFNKGRVSQMSSIFSKPISNICMVIFSLLQAIQDDAESIHQLVVLLSDLSIEVKQNALTDLMKMARESTPSLWENQFKDILMTVVEKMKDPEVSAFVTPSEYCRKGTFGSWFRIDDLLRRVCYYTFQRVRTKNAQRSFS